MEKSFLILFLLIVLSISIAAEGNYQSVDSKPPTTVLHNDFPNIFRPIGNFFKRIFGKKQEVGPCITANVTNLALSRTEITTECLLSNKKSCLEINQSIEISTDAIDPENDVLTYSYFITSGKIVGEGARVVWDLSGAEPGIYTITAAVDDGCGFCGQTITKEIKVVECADCKNP